MLHLDQAGLDVPGLGRFLAEPDTGRHFFRPARAGMAAAPVTNPRVRLGLQRAQVGDQSRREVLPGAPQRCLGVLDDLPIQPEKKGPG